MASNDKHDQHDARDPSLPDLSPLIDMDIDDLMLEARGLSIAQYAAPKVPASHRAQIEAGWRSYCEQASDAQYVNPTLCRWQDLGERRVLVLANKARTMALVIFSGDAPTPTQVVPNPSAQMLSTLAARVRAANKGA
jgi:hypothetical protein